MSLIIKFFFFVFEIISQTSILQNFYSFGFGSKVVTCGRQNNDTFRPTELSVF